MTVKVVPTKDDVISTLCEIIERKAKENIEANGKFNIGVSGGSLATFLTVGLPKIQTDFSKWKIFFCDERLVPSDDPDSTFGLYKTKLIDSGVVDLKEEQFVTAKQGVSPEDAAVDYTEKLAKFFPNDTLPRFDMLLLGMGPDGHTCSLFPGHKLLAESDKWVASITDSPKPPPNRITLTFPVINNAKMCIFAVCGKDKQNMLTRILKDKEDLPATKVKPTRGEVWWILDNDAGAPTQTAQTEVLKI